MRSPPRDTYWRSTTRRWPANVNIAGISRSGVSGSYSYSVIGSANHPVTYVSWGDAARFANWLHNGQPTGLQNASTTEDGAYTLERGAIRCGLNAVTRNAGATWFIPTENEWYKAAYYRPPAAVHIILYPTGSNLAPTASGPTALANHANFNNVVGNLTDVGAYTGTTSPYGTFDQGGNVIEWNETLRNGCFGGMRRALRGGSWDGHSTSAVQSSYRYFNGPALEANIIGFRVASVP